MRALSPLFFGITLLSATALAAEPPAPATLKKLDPHGEQSSNLRQEVLNAKPGCVICHSYDEGKGVVLRDMDINEACQSCHAKPHPGLNHHLARNYRNEKGDQKMVCLTCHRTHRAKLPGQLTGGRVDMERAKKNPFLPKGANPTALMIVRDCAHCHPKGSLK